MANGLSSADLRARAAVPTLRRNGGPAVPDPMAEASRVTKEMVANRMMLNAVSSESAEAAKADAEAARAKTEALAAKIELQKLQESSRSEGQASDQWQQFILEELKETRQGLEEARQAVAQMQVNALMERLSLLEGELGRIRERPPETPPDTTAMVTQAIAQARALVEIATPQGPATLPPADSSMVDAWRYRAELDHERWKVQHESDHEARMEKIKQDGETARAEIAARDRQAAQTNRFMTDTAPEIVKVLKQAVAGLFPNGVPEGAARPQIATPPGMVAMACHECGTALYYRENWPGVACSQCGAEYTITPDQAQETGEGKPASSASLEESNGSIA